MNQSQLLPQPASGAHEELAAFRIISFAEVIGLVQESPHGGNDSQRLLKAVTAFQTHGIGRAMDNLVGTNAETGAEAEHRRDVVFQLQDAIYSSPLPSQEWGPLLEILGDNLLGALTGVSASSMYRYKSAERPTPDPVAARLHFTALLVADLRGSYNDFGVHRWFQRARAQLHGKTPLQMLEKDWTPDGQGAMAVKELAAALLAPPSS